jgi:DNA repair photolyase
MWKKVTALNSKYSDTFDWSVYDRLQNRFADKPPRGGVVYGQNLKLVNYQASCSKCHYSLELDTYGRGCVHNCKYCYAKEQLVRRKYWNEPIPMPVDLSEIRKIFYTVFETSGKSKWRSVLEKRIPIRLGSMSDSFMWMDLKMGVTKELLKILKFYEYPFIIFTRSDLVAHDEYLKVLDPKLCSVQFSISGTNDELTKKIEPGAPSNDRRFKALKKLNASGFWTTVRLNPLFPTFPDGYFTDRSSVIKAFGSEENIPRLNLFEIEKTDEWMGRLKEARVPSVLAGFVRLTQNAIAYVGRDAGVDFKTFFKPDIYSKPGERVYSDKEIKYYYNLIHQSAAKNGIRFSTCFIGNGIKDYFQYQQLWSNKFKDCCDVKGNVSSFQESAQSIPWSERYKHAFNTDDAKKVELQEMAWDNVKDKTFTENNIENSISPGQEGYEDNPRS